MTPLTCWIHRLDAPEAAAGEHGGFEAGGGRGLVDGGRRHGDGGFGAGAERRRRQRQRDEEGRRGGERAEQGVSSWRSSREWTHLRYSGAGGRGTTRWCTYCARRPVRRPWRRGGRARSRRASRAATNTHGLTSRITEQGGRATCGGDRRSARLDGDAGRRRRAAAALLALRLAAERHDGGAHGHAAEGDDEAERQQRQRRAAVTVGRDQAAQIAGIERQQAAEHEHGKPRADREIDGDRRISGRRKRRMAAISRRRWRDATVLMREASPVPMDEVKSAPLARYSSASIMRTSRTAPSPSTRTASW